jgi:hypothetical protein
MPFPTKELVSHAVHAFRYLAGTVDLALAFEVKGDPVCCVDADSRGDVDSQRSKTSFSFMLFETYVSWQSRLQRMEATSTTKAKYMAAAAGVHEVLWMKILCANLDLPLSPGRL